MKNVTLTLLLTLGMGLAFSDFVICTDFTIGPLHARPWILLVPSLFFLVTISVVGFLRASPRTSDRLGWLFVIVVAGLSALLGAHRAGFVGMSVLDPTEVPPPPKALACTQLAVASVFVLIALAKLAGAGAQDRRHA